MWIPAFGPLPNSVIACSYESVMRCGSTTVATTFSSESYVVVMLKSAPRSVSWFARIHCAVTFAHCTTHGWKDSNLLDNGLEPRRHAIEHPLDAPPWLPRTYVRLGEETHQDEAKKRVTRHLARAPRHSPWTVRESNPGPSLFRVRLSATSTPTRPSVLASLRAPSLSRVLASTNRRGRPCSRSPVSRGHPRALSSDSPSRS
jgi:hypothetical protein